jgi:hypothetical protein
MTNVDIVSNRRNHPMDYSFKLNEQFSFYHPLMKEVVRVKHIYFRKICTTSKSRKISKMSKISKRRKTSMMRNTRKMSKSSNLS